MLPANGKRANGMELSERKKEILKSVVDAYIASGEPVGSKFLTTVSQIPLSSATIRNEMSELEEMGYLEQPHTSAGRVPTALGYRTYVNSLMERYRLSLEELSLLNELTAYKMDELGKIMEQASHVISEVTNYPTFAVIKPPESDVNRYETVLIDDHSFLLIMIGANGTVRNRNVRLKSLIDQEALEALRKALNGVLLGTAVSDISLPVVLKFEEALGQYAYLSTPILRVLYEMANATDTERVHVEGVTKLFSYPEFNNVTKAKDVLELMGEREKFTAMLTDADPEKANVFIGGDDADSPLPDSSFVVRPVTVDGKTVGAIGVIGPKRMDYKKVLASLDYFATGLSEELDGHGKPKTETRITRHRPKRSRNRKRS